MTSAKDPKEKQPGEKPAGKFHYNPGNMAGKEVEVGKDDGEGKAKSDAKPGRNRQA
ncbi:hypothetical protein BH11PSE3_BH11PSE3_37880 [soil metagenome]